MNRSEAKQAILEKALRSIRLDGIRATKMDDLVASLGISKRTLYELYPSKFHLVSACIRAMQEEWKAQVSSPSFLEGNSIERIRRFLFYYISTLYQVRLSFWTDLHRNEKLKASCQDMKQEWLSRCAAMVEECQREGYFLADLTPSLLGDRLMSGLFQSRLDHYTDSQQYLFCCIILRGASTPAGIRLLDRK